MMDGSAPIFSSTPGVDIPVVLKAFENPETSRAALAALLAGPAPRRNLSLVPPRIVAHPNFDLQDLIDAAATPDSLAAALLTNPGVLLRLVELHYAGAPTTAEQRQFVETITPYISHDNLLYLNLHQSPAIRSFARDVLRVHVRDEGDLEGLRRALRLSGDYGVLVPVDPLEGAVLDLTSLEELEAVEEDENNLPAGGVTAFVSAKSDLLWVVDPVARVAQAERGRVTLDDRGWWHYVEGSIHVQVRAGEATAEDAGLSPLTVSLTLGLLRLSEPWVVAAGAVPPETDDWRQVAGEGIAALIKAGVVSLSAQTQRRSTPEYQARSDNRRRG